MGSSCTRRNKIGGKNLPWCECNTIGRVGLIQPPCRCLAVDPPIILAHPYCCCFQPVCEGIGRQTAVDLTTQASFVVGRSPACDVQLMHATSSRRHAMIFHHSNGACYIVDCGSAHGTYINGVRVPPPTEGGVVVPQKVRRGAMIRFGGPGAPCFILKSFSFALGDIAACGEAVRRNTRWNALGSTARTFITLDRKRSFDSLSSAETIDISERYFEPQTKRMRCESPPMTEEAPLRMVTPPVSSPRKRVVFSDEQPQCFYAPCVTPEESSAAA